MIVPKTSSIMTGWSWLTIIRNKNNDNKKINHLYSYRNHVNCKLPIKGTNDRRCDRVVWSPDLKSYMFPCHSNELSIEWGKFCPMYGSP